MPEPTTTEVTLVTSKPWYESLTIWGAVVGIAGTILGFFNIALAPETQSVIVDGVVKIATGWTAKDWGAMFSGLTALVGGIMAIVGRKQADQPVHFASPFTTETKAPLEDIKR